MELSLQTHDRQVTSVLYVTVPYGEISHSNVRDLASLSDDSLGPPVSLSDVRFR